MACNHGHGGLCDHMCDLQVVSLTLNLIFIPALLIASTQAACCCCKRKRASLRLHPNPHWDV